MRCVYPYGLGARQSAYMVRYGLSPMQAIQSATTVTAQLLKRSADVGAISPGHFGDLIAVNGDPLKDPDALTRVIGVIKGGHVDQIARTSVAGETQSVPRGFLPWSRGR